MRSICCFQSSQCRASTIAFRWGGTALHTAALENRIALAEILLQHFPAVNALTDRRSPQDHPSHPSHTHALTVLPLHSFHSLHHESCFRLPLDAAQNSHFPCCSGLTALDFAVEKKLAEPHNLMLAEMTELLQKHGVRAFCKCSRVFSFM